VFLPVLSLIILLSLDVLGFIKSDLGVVSHVLVQVGCSTNVHL
jgi:hypothetical protein